MLSAKIGNRNLYSFLQNISEGEVLGVFSSGIYFSLNNKILMLHDDEYGSLPFGLAVDGFSEKGKSFGLELGMKLVNEKGSMAFADGRLGISYEYIERKSVKLSLDCLADFTKKTEKVLKKDGRSPLWVFAPCDLEGLTKETIEDLFASVAYAGIKELVFAMEMADEKKLEGALMKLLGLGRGLTPSLDDFITGVMYVLNRAKIECDINIGCLTPMCKVLERIVPLRTNVYSAAYLISSAAGEDFSIMRRCLETSMDACFEESLERLMKVGGSSGADMLSGMCFAANYILKQR